MVLLLLLLVRQAGHCSGGQRCRAFPSRVGGRGEERDGGAGVRGVVDGGAGVKQLLTGLAGRGLAWIGVTGTARVR